MKLIISIAALLLSACQLNAGPLPDIESERMAEWIEIHECANVEYRLWVCEWPTRMFIFAPPSD